jgi:ribonuclease D
MTRTRLERSLSAADHPILLETAAQLSEAKKSWSGKDILGIDTEFVRERTYRAQLGLVQVSDGETAWLVDPVRLEGLGPLQALLEDPGVIKVLHSGSEDLEVLLHSVGSLPEPLVDTQIACAMLGQPLQMGYHATVQWLFGVEVDKEQTRSNWCRRPLTDRQLHYAAMDVVLLPEMHETLVARLSKNGRLDWMREEVQRAQRNARQVVAPEKAYLRIAGMNRLGEDAMPTLRALAAWREEVARQKNLARGFIIADAGLVNLARARPSTLEDLQNVEGIHPKALARYANALLTQIREAARDDRPVRRPAPLDNAQRRRLGELRDLVQNRARELEVEPALLASRRELERLLRAVEAGRDIPERFTGWRQAVITDDLVALIR